MTEEQLAEMMTSCEEEVKKGVKERIVRIITEKVNYQVEFEVSQMVGKFVNEHILPAVKEHLLSSKDALIKAGCVGASTCGDQLAKALETQFATKLNDSYRRGQILKAMFE